MEKYANILEYIPSHDTNKSKIKRTRLYEIFNKFNSNHSLCKKQIYTTSLSGGVDSMVLTYLLYVWVNKESDIQCLHINYNNRSETDEEEQFLKEWCENLGIDLKILHFGEYQRSAVARNEYELETRRQRYTFYRENCEEIYLGHHGNDVAENAFCNIMKGRNILDLSVITEISTNMGVTLLRPLRDIPKKEILQFAHKFGIPYFKDTTPQWSNRGKLRNKIFTAIEDQFGSHSQIALYELAQQSDQMRQMFDKMILEPYLKNVVNEKYGFIFPLDGYENMPILFWNTVLMTSLHSVGISMPKRSQINILVGKIISKFEGQISLKDGFTTILIRDKINVIVMIENQYLDFFKIFTQNESNIAIHDKLINFMKGY